MTFVVRFLTLIWLGGSLALPAQAAFDAVLEGRSAGETNWAANNLRNWRELDLAPMRVYMTGGPVMTQALTIEIDHSKSGLPGIEDLSAFTPSGNVVITSGPTLSAPAGAETWTYRFTFNLTNSAPGYLEFRARLASGSRFNAGSSLHLYGAPSLGVLQFHRVEAAGTPDLAISKSGPASAKPGDVINYSLAYTNKASANSAAGNVQLKDVLPPGASFASSAIPAPSVFGNILTWNLGILDPGASGTISFRATVASSATNRQVLENFSTIASDQTDANLADNTAKFRTTIAVASAPVANNDSYTVLEDNVLTISAPGILGNDASPDGNALSARLTSGPRHGDVSLLSNGSFIYTPERDFFGSDDFTYTAFDGRTNSAVARVAITVMPVNDAPTARPDAYQAREDTALSIAAPGVLGNDADIDSTALQAIIVSPPAHGTLALSANGGFEYQPNKDLFGGDSFVYRVSDGAANSPSATVGLTVIPVNDPPSFAIGPNQTVQQSSGAHTVAGWATQISAGPANEARQTVQFTVTNDQPALFSAQPEVSPSGTLTFTPAADAHGVARVTVILKDSGGTADGGVDVSAPEPFAIRINAPPTAELVIPTNGTVFLAPANIPLLARAQDADGMVVKVELIEGTNVLIELSNMPYSMIRSNAGAGTYQFMARATDDLGAVGLSAPVVVTVLERPPVVGGTMRFNPQTGLFEQPVRVSNPSSFPFTAVCVFVDNLPARCEVYNRSGISNGLPFVQYNSSVAAGQSADMLIEYYDPLRIVPSPTLFAEAVPQLPPFNPAGSELRVSRHRWLADGTFMIEFNSVLARNYYVQYCDVFGKWKTALPSVSGTGTRAQWIDNGPPRTESPPARTESRMYRVLLAP